MKSKMLSICHVIDFLQAIDIGLVVYNTLEQTGYITSAHANDSVASSTTPAQGFSTAGMFQNPLPADISKVALAYVLKKL